MGSLREYETVFILHPNLDETRVEEEIEGVRQVILGASGEIVQVDRWGRRKLAYEIRKLNEGIYTLLRFRAEAGVLQDLERRYRLREDVLRHLTVVAQGPIVESAPRRIEAAVATEGAEGAVDGESPQPEASVTAPAMPETTSSSGDAPAESAGDPEFHP